MLRMRFLFEIAFPALVMCWTAIMLYSAAVSDTGYRALAALEKEAQEKAQALEAMETRRLELEKRADLLSSRSLDPDLLDERIRAVLGYSREGDIVTPRREIDRLLQAPNQPSRR